MVLLVTFVTLTLKLSLANFLNFENNACNNFNTYPIRIISNSCYKNPDVGVTTPDIIKNHGFQAESYTTTTPDGYILQLFRIKPKSNDNRKNKQPIVFVAGILSDSSAFVYIGNRSLAFSLAREGYDIWLTNHRGSIYSPGHVYLDKSSREYWNWTIDTVVDNDVPANLKTVANVTGKAGSIIYIGHSRGTILAYMYASKNPNQKFLKGVIALAPCAYQNPKLHIRAVLAAAPFLEASGMKAWFENPSLIMTMAQTFCPTVPYVCLFIASLISGHSNQFLPDDLLNFFSHFPSQYCIKEYGHLNQLIQTGRLQKYDYGAKKNVKVYGQKTPPVYDLHKISLSFFLFYSLHDVFVTNDSVTRQFDDLGSKNKAIYKIPVDMNADELQWAHNDVLYGKDLERDLNKHVKMVIEQKLRS